MGKSNRSLTADNLPKSIARLHSGLHYIPVPEDAVALVATERQIGVVYCADVPPLDFAKTEMVACGCGKKALGGSHDLGTVLDVARFPQAFFWLDNSIAGSTEGSLLIVNVVDRLALPTLHLEEY